MTNGQRQPPFELTIGVVGPHDLVERIMLSGAATSGHNGTRRHWPAAGQPTAPGAPDWRGA